MMKKCWFYSVLTLLFTSAPLAWVQADEHFSVKVENNTECVVLLHGMGRTKRSFQKMESSLLVQGYQVWNSPYRSSSGNISGLAESAIDPALDYCRAADVTAIHFVTHSLGGIMVRQYLQDHEILELDKVVMIAPPNHGSEVADVLSGTIVYKWILGAAALELGTQEEGLIAQLNEVPGTIGIIAGNESWNFIFSWIIPGPDDGKVSVKSTELKEMADKIELPESHTFILRSESVIQQTIYFLKNGCFEKSRRLAQPPN
ncbi:esterase/lipase family protein [Aurantivibrio infirmus]